MHLANQVPPSRADAVLHPAGFNLMPSIQPRWRWYPPLKFAVEWLLALVLLIPIGIVVVVAAVLIKLTSPGKPLYRQTRVGRNGRVFTMIKLRTMIQNSETNGPVWSQPGDPRVTPLGRILRDTHIDELPQIWNVLCGQMSLIGPRPERPEIVVELEQTVANYRDRVAVRPGLTGLAQVKLPPDVNTDTVRRKLAYDRYYVEWVSPWLDTRIALSTVLYFGSAAMKALCNAVIRSYERDIERRYMQSSILADEPEAAQTA